MLSKEENENYFIDHYFLVIISIFAINEKKNLQKFDVVIRRFACYTKKVTDERFFFFVQNTDRTQTLVSSSTVVHTHSYKYTVII